MGAPAAIVAAGTIISLVGQQQKADAEAEQERQNEIYFNEQANNIFQAGVREESIFVDETEDILGRQISSFAKGGVTLEGSPMLLLKQNLQRAREEIGAIRFFRDQNVRLARLRGQSAGSRADGISSAQFGRSAGTILTGAGTIVGGT